MTDSSLSARHPAPDDPHRSLIEEAAPEGEAFAAPAAPVMTLEQAKRYGQGRTRDADLPAVAGGWSYR